MRFLSVCSGIEAASVAWNPLGWKAVAFSEIEPFPCAVLAHHYPDTPNWGDMTKYKEWPDVAIDLLCGGTPCQSFSIAGLRKGLDDPRGNLMLTFGAIAAKYRPKWLVWENVPGVLSSNKGRDFGAFLGMLGQLGYGFAYRVLDAQFFGVPQRRRRVFVVGCLGDWRSAAAVLFERHGLSGDPAPSRKARQSVAPTLSARTKGGGGLGTDFDCDGGLIARRLTRGSGGGQRYDAESETLIAHSLRGEGFDASEDGTGRGTPLVPVAFAQNQRDEVRLMNVAGALAAEPGAKQQTYVATPAIGFDCKSSGQNGFGIGLEVAGTQRAMAHANSHTNGGGHQAVAYAIQAGALRENPTSGPDGVGVQADHAYTLEARAEVQAVASSMQVRRLTPEECEALQAYPRNYTRIAWRGKPPEQCPDGPRYKALGNSWCTNNARWIGERIDRVNSILEAA